MSKPTLSILQIYEKIGYLNTLFVIKLSVYGKFVEFRDKMFVSVWKLSYFCSDIIQVLGFLCKPKTQLFENKSVICTLQKRP